MASARKPFLFEIVDKDPETGRELAKLIPPFKDEYVRIGPKKYLIYKSFRSEAENIYNMPLRSDDVFLVTYPRSGTTVMSELIYVVANDFNFEKAASKELLRRAPFLELYLYIDDKLKKEILERPDLKSSDRDLAKFVTTPLTQLADSMPSPRTIKTHVPLSLLPPDLLDKAKVVYMARDPRDVVVSFYHLHCLWKGFSYSGDFKTYWDLFRNDKVLWNPYFEHMKESWEQRNNPNMLFLFYEELLKDPIKVVRKVSSFLGKQPTDEQVSQLVSHVHIDNFRKNETTNGSSLLRLGTFTDWKEPFIRKAFKDEYVRIGPKKYLIYKSFRSEAENIYNLPLRSDDVFLVTYPRSGTTVMSELIYIVANDFNFEKAASDDLLRRAPFLELHLYIDDKLKKEILERPDLKSSDRDLAKFITTSLTQLADSMPSPRTIKTHVPLSLLPPDLLDKAKVVYMARDPRDVVVSFYHLHGLWKGFSYNGDFKTFWDLLRNDKVIWNPFFEHMKESWEQRNNPNMLFMFYDELLKDPIKVVRKVSSFLGKQPTDEQVSQLANHVHIDNFRRNETSKGSSFRRLGVFTDWKQPFIRKGQSGGWRDYFDEEMTLQAEQWIQNNLKDTDLRFPDN